MQLFLSTKFWLLYFTPVVSANSKTWTGRKLRLKLLVTKISTLLATNFLFIMSLLIFDPQM